MAGGPRWRGRDVGTHGSSSGGRGRRECHRCRSATLVLSAGGGRLGPGPRALDRRLALLAAGRVMGRRSKFALLGRGRRLGATPATRSTLVSAAAIGGGRNRNARLVIALGASSWASL